jgi:hypothetical protein
MHWCHLPLPHALDHSLTSDCKQIHSQGLLQSGHSGAKQQPSHSVLMVWPDLNQYRVELPIDAAASTARYGHCQKSSSVQDQSPNQSYHLNLNCLLQHNRVRIIAKLAQTHGLRQSHFLEAALPDEMFYYVLFALACIHGQIHAHNLQPSAQCLVMIGLITRT